MSDVETRVVEGIANCLWACAWADHVEETGCANLSGCNVYDHMPPVPSEVEAYAWRVVGRVEQAAGMPFVCLYAAALKADGRDYMDEWREPSELSERFGECIAYMTHGHGVSWFDDHADYERLSKAVNAVHMETDFDDLTDRDCDGEHGE